MEFGEKKTQNKGYYGVQGHSGLVPIESPYATSYYWLIVTGILSRTVSELSQLIVQILDTAFLSHPWGLTNNVHIGLTAKRVVEFLLVLIELFSLGVTAQSLAKRDRKSAISVQRGQFDLKFQVQGVVPPIIFARIVRLMNALQLCRWQFSHKETL